MNSKSKSLFSIFVVSVIAFMLVSAMSLAAIPAFAHNPEDSIGNGYMTGEGSISGISYNFNLNCNINEGSNQLEIDWDEGSTTTVSVESVPGFAVLAGSTVTNTIVTESPTVISGDLGLYPGTSVTGFPPGIVVNGAQYVAEGVAAQAQIDLTAAYNSFAGLPGAVSVSGDLTGLTLYPGIYNSGSSLGLTGDLTLDALGDENAVFVFQIGSELITGSGSEVILQNNAKASNVFWQVGSSATLGTGSIFKGTIMADQSISLTTGATLDGRALARIGAVTLDDNTITAPTTFVETITLGSEPQSFVLQTLTTTNCFDDPTLDPGLPPADFDLIEFSGSGSLNGVNGAFVWVQFGDNGEPGDNDMATIVVYDAGGNVVLDMTGGLTSGNNQANTITPITPQSTLIITTIDSNSNPIDGYFVTLSQNGAVINAWFSPSFFTVNNNQEYVVSVSDFGDYQFVRWLDTGSTVRERSVVITSDTLLTAVFTNFNGSPPIPSNPVQGNTGNPEDENDSDGGTGTASGHTFTITGEGNAKLRKAVGDLGRGTHAVMVEITGGYSFDQDGKLTIDKDSLVGTLTIDGGTDDEITVDLDINTFKVTDSDRKIRYSATIDDDDISGKVSGILKFRSSIDFENAEDADNVVKTKSTLTVKIEKTSLNVKRIAAGEIDFS